MHLVIPNTTYEKRLIKYKGSQFWNNLPETLKSVQSILHMEKDRLNIKAANFGIICLKP